MLPELELFGDGKDWDDVVFVWISSALRISVWFFIPHFIGDREVGDHIMSGGSDFQRRAFISLFLK